MGYRFLLMNSPRQIMVTTIRNTCGWWVVAVGLSSGAVGADSAETYDAYRISPVFDPAVGPVSGDAFVAAVSGGQWLAVTMPYNRVPLVRLNLDGTVDDSFNGPGAKNGLSPTLHDAEMMTDGGVFLAWRSYMGDPKPFSSENVGAANSDGSENTVFEFSESVYSYFRMTDYSGGCLLVWGGSLMRLLSDGSRDPTFNPPVSVTSRIVNAVVVQSTGQIVVGLELDAGARTELIRLMEDGSIDNAFAGDSEFDGPITSIVVQSDDSIYASGPFDEFNGEFVGGLVRLTPTGQRDNNFDSGSGFLFKPLDFYPYQIQLYLHSDGQLFAFGSFDSYDDLPASGIVRLNMDGSLDQSFKIDGSSTRIGAVRAMAMDDTGRILLSALEVPEEYNFGRSGLVLLEPETFLTLVTVPSTPGFSAGSSPTLSVEVAGSPPFLYQWRYNGDDIEGATGATHTIASIQKFTEGLYSVVVSGSIGSALFDIAQVSVSDPPPSGSQMISLSTRAYVIDREGVMIPGFVIVGNGTKRLLIRAAGPTLGNSPFDMENTMPDPQLVLKRWDGSNYVDVSSSDNWSNESNAVAIEQAAAEVGAFELTSDLDSALLAELGAGQYTVVARDAQYRFGIGIVEVYDIDPTSSEARFSSLSNRGYAFLGDHVMIPGFVVSNEGPKRLLLRVVGPTLREEPFNMDLAGVDPAMAVYRRENNGEETLLFRNDDWGDNANAAETALVADQVSAFPLFPGSKDAAIVVTLEPGVYTVHGSAANGTYPGVVLVELYVVELGGP